MFDIFGVGDGALLMHYGEQECFKGHAKNVSFA